MGWKEWDLNEGDIHEWAGMDVRLLRIRGKRAVVEFHGISGGFVKITLSLSELGKQIRSEAQEKRNMDWEMSNSGRSDFSESE